MSPRHLSLKYALICRHTLCLCRAGDWFLFMYTCRTGQIVRFTSDNNFIPMWNMPGIPIDNMCTSFSAMGSAVVMPLRPSKGYEFEVAIFGGGTQVGRQGNVMGGMT
jgi:hypothetical protein